jgi:alkylation response protein AidB-like acyl-CoA dehydrogenase
MFNVLSEMMSSEVQFRAPLLTDEMLMRFHERAPIYDRENRFFTEDFEELREAGYLALAVPQVLGGMGMNLAEVCRQQRRLAYYAPATALALNMHLYWTGMAADLWRSGDKSLEWILRAAVAGEVFAAGHAEGGNDIALLFSTTKAERVEGGYRFTGRKSFGSLTPVWTYLGMHGAYMDENGQNKIVHAFMPRAAPGYTIQETWDTLGMRATRSDDTILDGAFVPDEYIARVLPAGFAGADAFVLTTFAWFLLNVANIYTSIARRSLDLTLKNIQGKKSIAMTRPMIYHPSVQFAVADMVMELEMVEPMLEKTAQDWANGVAHPDWIIKLLTAKCQAVERAWKIVDTAFEVGGGFGIFKRNEMERLFRDARLGRIHPGNAAFTREIIGKAVLGINPDEQPRWG